MKLRLLFCTAAVCGLMVSAQTPAPSTADLDKAWSILEAGVNEKALDKRAQAVGALGLLFHDRRAASMAETALQDSNSEVRTAAAHALGEMDARGSREALKNALTDGDPAVVLAIASSLHDMNDPAAFAIYYEILTGQRKTNSGIKGEVKVIHDPKKMAALGIEAGIGFVPFGGLGFGVIKFVSKDDISPIRASAAAVLSKDPDPQSSQALSNAVDDAKWMVQVAAIRALALRGDKEYLDAVAAKMSAERALLSYTAAAAVIRLNAKPLFSWKKATAKGAPKN